jgi:hypothetical protein
MVRSTQNNTNIFTKLQSKILGTVGLGRGSTSPNPNAVVGSVYSFNYTSSKATDKSPIIINIRRNGQRVYLAKNGRRYMGGINIKNLITSSPKTAKLIIGILGKRRSIGWKTTKVLAFFLRVPVSGLYRTYDATKINNLNVYKLPK